MGKVEYINQNEKMTMPNWNYNNNNNNNLFYIFNQLQFYRPFISEFDFH